MSDELTPEQIEANHALEQQAREALELINLASVCTQARVNAPNNTAIVAIADTAITQVKQVPNLVEMLLIQRQQASAEPTREEQDQADQRLEGLYEQRSVMSRQAMERNQKAMQQSEQTRDEIKKLQVDLIKQIRMELAKGNSHGQ